MSLEMLDLHSNNIKKIENLDNLTKLSNLILSQNQISRIQNLSKNLSLRSLNLAMNLLESVGSSLSQLHCLEELNLSGNKLCNIKEILKLKKIKSLKVICFFDPHFGENPICKIYNYQTFMLYHFNHLQKFDNLKVNEESKSCAEIEFKKKKIYYNMKIKGLRRMFITIKKILKSAKNARKDVIAQGIKLMKQFSSFQSPENRSTKDKAMKIYLTKIEEEAYLDETFDKVINHLQDELNRHIYFISKELESTGNFKLEEGKKKDRWNQSCINLVKSRFYPEDLNEFGRLIIILDVEDLNVYRVLRIHNRFLRNRFEDRIELYLDQSNPNYKKSFEYLFYGIDPKCPEEFWNIVEHGYRDPEDCSTEGLCPYIPLVNSVAAADLPRITEFLKSKENEYKNCTYSEALSSFKKKIAPGHLLVCKVIIVRPQQDPRFPIFDMEKSFTTAYKECPLDESLLKSDIVSSFREAKGDSRHKVWFIHDNTLVLPEYLVSFDYEPKLDSLPKYDSFYIGDTLLTSLDHELRLASPYTDKESIASIDQALNQSIEEIKKRQGNSMSTKDNASIELFNPGDIKASGINFMKLNILNFLLLCGAEDNDVKSFKDKLSMLANVKRKTEFTPEDAASMTTINFSSFGLADLPHLGTFHNLVDIDASFNRLVDLSFIKGLSEIVYLNVSANYLAEIPDLSHLMLLSEFDVSYNRIVDINTLKILSTNAKLFHLRARGNPFMKRFNKPQNVIMKLLPTVKYLDDRSLDTVREIENSRPSITFDYKLVESMNPTLPLSEISFLNLEKFNLTSIGDLSGLEKLLTLNLSWNRLTTLDDIKSLTLLKHLNAENNLISNIKAISELKELTKLSLGSNSIKEVSSCFRGLSKLTHLSIESNRIETLSGFKNLVNLLELYIGENYITDLKQVRHLASLKRLIVVDMSGNAMCKESDYRLYFIFQIKDVKVLDGITVSKPEIEEAKEAFNGRLSEDILEVKLKGQPLNSIKTMDLSRCKLRDFDSVFTSEKFPNVQEINLSGNFFTCFKNFRNIPNLKILILLDNRISSFEPIKDPKYKIGLNAMPVSQMIIFRTLRCSISAKTNLYLWTS